MKFNKDNALFLLGGKDLEMKEIVSVLEANGCTFCDKNPSWSEANLELYAKEIEADPSKHFYAIELNIDEDRNEFYKKYKDKITIIDHHGKYIDREASLLQVLELMDQKPTRKQQLIAANDARYIDGMKCIGATEAEIKEIRQQDREMQGIKRHDEIAAKNDVKSRKEKHGIMVVCATTPHFSAVSDELYFQTKPYNPSRYIIYNDDKIVFYGFKNTSLEKILNEGYSLSFPEAYYFGGGDYGYLGIKEHKIDKKKIQNLCMEVIEAFGKGIISSHIFMFPFRFDRHDTSKGFSNEFDFYRNKDIHTRISIEKLHSKLTENGWKYEPFRIEKGAKVNPLLYNEYAYFYDYVREVLYNKEQFSPDAISNFYRKKSIEEGVFTLCIKEKEDFPASTYRLYIDGITLRVFSTGVAILSIELHNYNYTNKNDIFRINDYGRRIYPQYIGSDRSHTTKGSFLAESISIEDSKGKEIAYEKFDYDTYEEIRVGDHIMQVLGTDVFTQCKCNHGEGCKNPHRKKCDKSLEGLFYIQSSLDDRMYVHSWYGSDHFSQKLKSDNKRKNKKEKMPYLYSDDWYKFIFVDNDKKPTVKNTKMKKDLIKKATYDRWSDDGMIYGITKYSFMLATDRGWFPANIVYNHMITMYFQMSTMLLANRTSILRFSDEVAAIASLSSPREEQRLHELYGRYLEFFDRLYFKEVTHQDQGIELYDIGLKQMRIPEHIDKLDGKFVKLHNFASLKQNNRESDTLNGLNLIVSALGISGLFIAIFSIGVFEYSKSWSSLFWAIGSAVAAGGITLWGMRSWIRHKKDTL
jgi:hypothetical protein